MSKDQTEGFVCTNLSDDLSNLSIKEIPIQSLSEDSLRISINAASLNFRDLLMTQGKYQNKPELPEEATFAMIPIYPIGAFVLPYITDWFAIFISTFFIGLVIVDYFAWCIRCSKQLKKTGKRDST